MKKLILVAFIIFIGNLNSQEKYLTNGEAKILSEKVVKLFEDNKISSAFNELKPYWPLPENELESIESKTIKYINIIQERFGKSIGFVKVKNELIADIALRETYILRYSKSAIRLIFTYYKSNKGWIINAFSWDDSFEEEFKLEK